ncbi:helix-turn-helix domain-containing protein [Pseudoalteromonas byunsanensis]|uniref:HTH cro/C1-type domain-containing protein n=1 Tax=Pseudoalteromonas byunsanensis TaxID=327939 RepID=A0A1S1NCH0_9GAMM|nr:helix-turn-helix transcriptional regulator [Pseudoalteromonas byunsanensis]OHU97165.1 hypothetical protein BIW53_02265 [Pseudoalteromonas byunsanensis]
MSSKTTKTDTNVCSNFKDERKRLNLNQKEVADFLCMSSKQISRWESSIAIPSDKLAELAAMGFDCMYVLTGNRSGIQTVGPTGIDIERAVEVATHAAGEAIKTVYDLKSAEALLEGKLDAITNYKHIVKAAEIIARAELTGKVSASTISEIAKLTRESS